MKQIQFNGNKNLISHQVLVRHNCKKINITLPLEWKKDLDRFKQEYFPDQSQGEILRYLIALGLHTMARDDRKSKQGGNGNG